ncbi:hypothetical protein BKA70DRAFT_1222292 [Coprinopsis sp. MPI-PUGE-AT-0042]|nr:hypothetical protein BKA70DRAFT_1222292 [Coprinopsis sp. MPI-PUGE-AT-0042]
MEEQNASRKAGSRWGTATKRHSNMINFHCGRLILPREAVKGSFLAQRTKSKVRLSISIGTHDSRIPSVHHQPPGKGANPAPLKKSTQFESTDACGLLAPKSSFENPMLACVAKWYSHTSVNVDLRASLGLASNMSLIRSAGTTYQSALAFSIATSGHQSQAQAVLQGSLTVKCRVLGISPPLPKITSLTMMYIMGYQIVMNFVMYALQHSTVPVLHEGGGGVGVPPGAATESGKSQGGKELELHVVGL